MWFLLIFSSFCLLKFVLTFNYYVVRELHLGHLYCVYDVLSSLLSNFFLTIFFSVLLSLHFLQHICWHVRCMYIYSLARLHIEHKCSLFSVALITRLSFTSICTINYIAIFLSVTEVLLLLLLLLLLFYIFSPIPLICFQEVNTI